MTSNVVKALVVLLAVLIVTVPFDKACNWVMSHRDKALALKPLTPPEQEALKKRLEGERIQQQVMVKYRREQDEKFKKSPAGRVQQKHPEWPRDMCETIAKHRIQIGMTREQAIAAWGRPQRNNRTVFADSEQEQWVYGDTCVYFDNGVLTSFQDSR
jgi:hypothetical protein